MTLLALSIVAFLCAIAAQHAWIARMHRLKLGEAIKEYGPEAHQKKRGTPSMGGVVALAMLPPLFFLSVVCELASLSRMLEIWAYPVMAAGIGLADDLLKQRRKSSEGLRSLQKLFLQVVVTLPWAYLMGRHGVFLLPDLRIAPLIGVPLLWFLGVGIQNAVNVTDGLDGLAAGAVAISLSVLLLLLPARENAALVSVALGLSLVLAFLWHNANPAALFMGDVGAHLWAGFLISLCVAMKFLILVVPIAFLFGVEIVSVAVQIVAIRKFHRKVFRMSPLHHHFELVGWSEQTIVVRFWLVHACGMAFLLLCFGGLGWGGGWIG